MSCPPPERLVEFVGGRLAEVHQAEIESHIDICEDCRCGLAALVDREEAPWALGRYRIDGVLGVGGMGIVYRGWDPALSRAVAVKVVRAGDDGELRTRLPREAQSLARLNHPNVCQVYDVGTDGDEVWVAMELVDGVTLRGWLGGRPARPEILAVLAGAARGLAAAHATGLVHRDVKPENVLIDHAGRAVVTDFGLARAADGSGAVRTTVLAGTPAYMAPEQLDGHTADARSDQYAFAVMAHEALTGARPRPRNQAAATLPVGMRAALDRALADAPADRFASVGELVDALSREPRRSRSGWRPIAALALVGGIGVGAFAILRTGDEAGRSAHADAVIIAAITADAAPLSPLVPIATIPAPDAGIVDAALAVATAAHGATTVRDAGVPVDARRDAAVSVDAAPPPPPPVVVDAGPSNDPSTVIPRIGHTRNVQNIRSKHITTLAEAEAVFASGYCVMPGGAIASAASHPVDWGKVMKIDEAVVRQGTSPLDALLIEVRGQHATYVVDGYWGIAIHGEAGVAVGDTVALCLKQQANWDLPAPWQGPVTLPEIMVRVGGAPDLHKLAFISWSEINATATDQRWPYGPRVLTYGKSGGALNNGRYMMAGWELEIDDTTTHPLDPRHGAWIVVDHARWEGDDAHPRVVLHAAEMREHVFPAP